MILAAGEALFDVFLDGDPAPAAARFGLTARAGGSPFNVAVGLARLDAPSSMLLGLSDDFLGRRLAAILETEGVSLDFAVEKSAPTTVSFVALDARGSASYIFHGAGAADRALTPADLPADLSEVEAVHVGSFSLVAEPTAGALLALTARAAGDRLVSIDANVRPTVEPDLDLWRARVAEHAARADLVKMSDEDLALLYPGETPERVAERLLGLGAGLAVVTLGENGALAMSAAGVARRPAEPVAVVDTVGAGDSFQAAMLAQLRRMAALSPGAPARLDDAALETLLAVATKAAAIACSRPGADPPRAAELFGDETAQS